MPATKRKPKRIPERALARAPVARPKVVARTEMPTLNGIPLIEVTVNDDAEAALAFAVKSPTENEYADPDWLKK